MILYISECGTRVGLKDGQVTLSSEMLTEQVPVESVTEIAFFGGGHITTEATKYFLENNIDVNFFSKTGKRYGGLSSYGNRNVLRLKNQIDMTRDYIFSVSFDKNIINAKINNQVTVLRRYATSDTNLEEEIKMMYIVRKRIMEADTVESIRGYEGIASRYYFEALGKLVSPEFEFSVRQKHPAKNPVNAMLNMGYSLTSNEIQGEIEAKNLCAYAGFMHADKPGHATLASDMIEEWRPVIVDSTILSMIRRKEIKNSDFILTESGCRFTDEGLKKYLVKLEKKMHTVTNYLSYVEKGITFRQAIGHQVMQLAKAIDEGNADLYKPIIIR